MGGLKRGATLRGRGEARSRPDRVRILVNTCGDLDGGKLKICLEFG